MRAKAIDTEARPGARTSVDSARSSRTVGAGAVDLVYIKNVLLKFMELKDKNLRRDLVPTLKMLLDLDSKEERKWLEAVAR